MIAAVGMSLLFGSSLVALWLAFRLPGVRMRDWHKLEVTVGLPQPVCDCAKAKAAGAARAARILEQAQSDARLDAHISRVKALNACLRSGVAK